MRYRETLQFCGQTYRREEGTFKVPLALAKGLRMGDIPGHSTLEITELPTVPTGYKLFIGSTNAEDDGCFTDLNINAGILIAVDEHLQCRISRVQRLYEPLVVAGQLQESTVFRSEYGDWKMASVGWSLKYPKQPEVIVTEAISPILERFVELSSPDIHLFLCHAGEDKPFVERLAEFLQNSGASVWFDKWEIRVGDSIVQKVNEGLSTATHIAVVLSSNSVKKPWVEREMSSALMRQLANKSISLIPVLIEDCQIPAILADIKYADCRADTDAGFRDVLTALRYDVRITQ